MDLTETAIPTPATPERPDPLPWGAITHGGCQSWWTGTSRAHCPVCCRTFSCDSAADEHRIGSYGPDGDRRCVDPASAGLAAREKPYGALWGWPGPDPETAARIAGARSVS